MSNDTIKRFNELNKDNNLICTEQELQEFLVSGLLFETKNHYVDRLHNNVNVDIIKTKVSNYKINLNNLIGICEEKCKSLKINKIYCMSESCYNKYKENGMIISQGSEEYFRLFEKELWLVYKF